MTPIQVIYQYLLDSGALNGWEYPTGTAQVSPTVQLRLLKEENIPNTDRLLLIKSVSSSGDRFTTEPVFVFAVMGKVGENPVYAESYAQKIFDALLEFDWESPIISIDPISGVNGAYLTESGRPAYDFECMVKVDSCSV